MHCAISAHFPIFTPQVVIVLSDSDLSSINHNRYEPIANAQIPDGWLSLYVVSDSLQVVKHDGEYNKRKHLQGEANYQAQYYSFDLVIGSKNRVVYWRWGKETEDGPPIPIPQPVRSLPAEIRHFLKANGYQLVNGKRVKRGSEYGFVENPS